ncbi:hypothetical protein TNCV_3879261 [Trichonephila clavipes]|nr:hypothetical protein TNCV_3879261 [Trichonephila clavipes]
MVTHSGQTIVDKNIGERLSTASFRAATVGNAVKGFKKWGLRLIILLRLVNMTTLLLQKLLTMMFLAMKRRITVHTHQRNVRTKRKAEGGTGNFKKRRREAREAKKGVEKFKLSSCRPKSKKSRANSPVGPVQLQTMVSQDVLLVKKNIATLQQKNESSAVLSDNDHQVRRTYDTFSHF